MRIEPTGLPFHIARAYDIQRARQAPAPAKPVSPLVAAKVSRPAQPDAPAPVQPADSAAIPMYRHPADRNAAATAVTAGRLIDLEG